MGQQRAEMTTTRTHFTFRVDTWTPDGESIVEHVAGIEDYQVALATYRAACERWPGTPITLRQGARVWSALFVGGGGQSSSEKHPIRWRLFFEGQGERAGGRCLEMSSHQNRKKSLEADVGGVPCTDDIAVDPSRARPIHTYHAST